MRFQVSHSTVYRYSEPVFLEPHVIRLRPRCDGTQRLMQYQLNLAPEPAGRSECLDENGNAIVQAWYNEPVREMWVDSQFQLETLRENPYDFLLPPAEALALRVPDEPDGAVAEFASGIAQHSGKQAMPFLDALTERLFHGWRHVDRPEGAARHGATTLAAGEGSCRDLAMLFCEACRAVGLRARFVSGYEQASAQSDAAQMHAWAEVLLPGGGWRGFDASRGVAVGAGHVALAAAVDPAMAAPVSGAFRGAATARMEVSIAMQVG